MSESFWPDELSGLGVTAQIRAVLAQHPLRAEKGFYAGMVICDGCHVCFTDPTEHLLEALVAVLDPFHNPGSRPSERPGGERAPDRRESQVRWHTDTQEAS